MRTGQADRDLSSLEQETLVTSQFPWPSTSHEAAVHVWARAAVSPDRSAACWLVALSGGGLPTQRPSSRRDSSRTRHPKGSLGLSNPQAWEGHHVPSWAVFSSGEVTREAQPTRQGRRSYKGVDVRRQGPPRAIGEVTYHWADGPAQGQSIWQVAEEAQAAHGRGCLVPGHRFGAGG